MIFVGDCLHSLALCLNNHIHQPTNCLLNGHHRFVESYTNIIPNLQCIFLSQLLLLDNSCNLSLYGYDYYDVIAYRPTITKGM